MNKLSLTLDGLSRRIEELEEDKEDREREEWEDELCEDFLPHAEKSEEKDADDLKKIRILSFKSVRKTYRICIKGTLNQTL